VGTTGDIGKFLLDNTTLDKKVYAFMGIQGSTGAGDTGYGLQFTELFSLADAVNVDLTAPTGATGRDGERGATGATGERGATGGDQGLSWITSNLVNEPPAIVFGNPTYSTNEIYIPWTYPAQTNVGFLQVWVPAITKFSADLDYKYGSGSTSTINMIQAASTADYVDMHQSTTPITGIILTNLNVTSGIVANYPTAGKYAYRVYNVNFGSLIRDTVNNYPRITAWYGNYNVNTTNKSSTVSLNIFVQSQPSTETRAITGTSIGSVTYSVGYTGPVYADSGDTGSATAFIQKYDVINELSVESSKRYGSTLKPQTQKMSNTTTAATWKNAQSTTVTGVYPECTYNVSVIPTNSSGLTGPTGPTIQVTTGSLQPTAVAGYSSTSFTPSSTTAYFPSTTAIVNSPSSGLGANKVIKPTGTTFPLAYTSPALQIHSSTSRGSTNTTGLAEVTAKLTRGSTQVATTTQTFKGFPSGSQSASTASDGLSWISINSTDSYGTIGSNGYYLQVDPRVNVASSSTVFATPNHEQCTVALSYKQDGTSMGNTGSYSFYYDSLTTVPTISGATGTIAPYTSSIPTMKVSGVEVLSGSNFKLNITTAGIGNMGTYFYDSAGLLTYSSTIGSVTPATETSLAYITAGKGQDGNGIERFTGPLTFTRNAGDSSAITVAPTVGTYSSSFTVSATPRNIAGTGPAIISNSISLIIDPLSVAAVTAHTNLSSLPDLNNTSSGSASILSNVTGMRITSGSANSEGVTPYTDNSSDTKYDYNQVISSTQELQMVKGKLTSNGASSDGYINYGTYYPSTGQPNYSGLSFAVINGKSYRFATFKWNIVANTTLQYSGITFTLDGFTSSISPVVSNGVTIDGVPVFMTYRIVDGTNITPTDANSNTTVWVNALTAVDPVGNSSYYKTDKFWGGLSGTLTATTNAFSVKVFTPSINRISTVYCRIGLPMSTPNSRLITFSNVKATLST
jgi:hypothetical protein